MPLLHAEEIREEHVRKQKRRIEVYMNVLEKCMKRIMTAARVDQYECMFAIPTLMFGQPLFETKACLVFCVIKLIQYGYQVTVAGEDSLYISWKRHT